MIANSEFHYFVLVAVGFTLFFVKIGASDNPEKRYLQEINLRVFSLILFFLRSCFS